MIGGEGRQVAKPGPKDEERKTPRPFGQLRGKVWISDDFYEYDVLERAIEERLNRPIDP